MPGALGGNGVFRGRFPSAGKGFVSDATLTVNHCEVKTVCSRQDPVVGGRVSPLTAAACTGSVHGLELRRSGDNWRKFAGWPSPLGHREGVGRAFRVDSGRTTRVAAIQGCARESTVKGILLAGGSGTRLRPLTEHIGKQLLPVYDKPLIYYSLATLMLAGIRDVCIITTPRDVGATQELLGDGGQWGIDLSFAVQDKPRGIAEAFRLAGPSLGEGRVCLILGDNILHGPRLGVSLADLAREDTCVIFGYEVADPTSYGVVELDIEGLPISLQEKPAKPRSRLAVPGLYFYPEDVYRVAADIRPGARGEFEITDVNASYLDQGRLRVVELPRGTAWMDCGTIEDLYEASAYIQVLTRRQGMRIGCPEEIAWRNGWISDADMMRLAEPLKASGYGKYLLRLLAG